MLTNLLEDPASQGKNAFSEPFLFEQDLPKIDENNPFNLRPDYLTITFKTDAGRENFFMRLEYLLELKIPKHTMGLYRKVQPTPKTDCLYSLFETNGRVGANCLYELSFPGEKAQIIIQLFFTPYILESARQHGASLKRFDLCLDTSYNEENLPEAFSSFQAQQKNYEMKQKSPRTMKYTYSDLGEILYIEPKQVNYKIRIYAKKKKAQSSQSVRSEKAQSVRCELELRTSSLKNLTAKWLNGEKKEFLIESVAVYTRLLETIVTTHLTENITKLGMSFLKKWLTNLEPKRARSIKASTIHIKVQDSVVGKTSLLLHKTFYPVYLAIFHRSLLFFEEQQQQQFPQTFNLTFSFEDLLITVGWPNTRHYQRLLVTGIIQLEKVSFVSENRNTRAFYQLITNSRINKKEKTVFLELNGPLLNSLKESKFVDPMYFANTVRDYKIFFKNSLLPLGFFPLLSQSFAAVNENVIYSGFFPKNQKSAKHILDLVHWIFCTCYVETNLLCLDEIKVEKSTKYLFYILPTGSFLIHTRRERKTKAEIETINPNSPGDIEEKLEEEEEEVTQHIKEISEEEISEQEIEETRKAIMKFLGR